MTRLTALAGTCFIFLKGNFISIICFGINYIQQHPSQGAIRLSYSISRALRDHFLPTCGFPTAEFGIRADFHLGEGSLPVLAMLKSSSGMWVSGSWLQRMLWFYQDNRVCSPALISPFLQVAVTITKGCTNPFLKNPIGPDGIGMF